MIRVSFQGERGAYSEAAARSFFDEVIEPVPLSTFSKVLQSTSKDETQYAILPVENSLEGSVGESYDLLYSTHLNAIGEVYHKIDHCLIGTGKLDDIDTVYSHPQALGQCRKFIESHHMKKIPTYDTAGSIKHVKSLGRNNFAGIASKEASEIYEMPIISHSIADNTNNYTRFLVLSKTTKKRTGTDKTSIIFSIKHEPGALFEIIENFHRNNVNLTKIESRPTKINTWEYNFYADFEGHVDEPKISEMIKKIKHKTSFMKILGSYASAKLD